MLNQRGKMTENEWKTTEKRLQEAYDNMQLKRLDLKLRKSLRIGPLFGFGSFIMREKFIASLKKHKTTDA